MILLFPFGGGLTASSDSVTTVADIITAAFRRINVISAGDVPSPDDMADGFLRLNDLIDAWQTQRLFIPYIKRTVFTITSTKGTIATPYTVGTGGDVDTLRPTTIQHLSYQDTSLTPKQEYDLGRMMTDDEWACLAQKDLTGTLPSRWYYNPTYAGGLGSLYLWPVPSQANLQGLMYAPAGIGKFAATSDEIVLPPGYLRCIRENLAIEFAPEWRDSISVDQTLAQNARQSMADVKRINIRPEEMSCGIFGGGGWYDINSGTYLR